MSYPKLRNGELLHSNTKLFLFVKPLVFRRTKAPVAADAESKTTEEAESATTGKPTSAKSFRQLSVSSCISEEITEERSAETGTGNTSTIMNSCGIEVPDVD
jgi:hypothetical protein